jgi:hypothetical protein
LIMFGEQHRTAALRQNRESYEQGLRQDMPQREWLFKSDASSSGRSRPRTIRLMGAAARKLQRCQTAPVKRLCRSLTLPRGLYKRTRTCERLR